MLRITAAELYFRMYYMPWQRDIQVEADLDADDVSPGLNLIM